MKKVIVTTSWDDGAVEDLRLLALLEKYNLKGTFYIPKKINFEVKKGQNLEIISEKDVLKIAETQEIGAHTLNHIYLDKLNKDKVYNEVKKSKEWLGNLLKKPVKIFAYPGGVFNKEITEIVKKSGFLGARTSILFQTDIKDPFLMGLSSQCYPCFPRNKEWSLFFELKMALNRAKINLRGIIDLRLPIASFFNWKLLTKNVFKHILKNGGIFHLYGHSWEIERYNLWKDLEKLFKYISNKKNVSYLTNSEALLNFYEQKN